METVIPKRLSFNIRRIRFCLCFIVLLTFAGCNRIKEVEVKVYDSVTKQGIPNIQLFHGGKEYKTNEDGIVIISNKSNLKGSQVARLREIVGYVNPGYYSDCLTINSYKINSEKLLIPLEKLSWYKITVWAKNNQSEFPREACLEFLDEPCAEHKYFTDVVLKSDNFLFRPPSSIENTFQGIFRTDFSNPRIGVRFDNNCSDTSSEPDTVFSLNTIRGDTVKFTIYI
jgi:hypothetical protein